MTPVILESIGGVAHEPAGAPRGVVVLTHGAGGNRDSPMLVAVCEQWAHHGWLAVRYDLPFRRRRPTGPPPGSATADQAGTAEAIRWARALAVGPVIAGGHSYGGRLTSMAVADGAQVDLLALFSYPLHPPGKPDRLRTGHFAAIGVPAVFTHGGSDPFGSIGELRQALPLIPAATTIVEISGARHDLKPPKGSKVTDVAAPAVQAALRLGGWD